METLLSPWDRHGDCDVHVHNRYDFQTFLKTNLTELWCWTNFIYRWSRPQYVSDDVPPTGRKFPEHVRRRWVDRRQLFRTDNLLIAQAVTSENVC